MGARKINTRRILQVVLVCLLLVLAILVFVVMLLGGIEKAVGGLTRVELVPKQDIELVEAGTYAVFWEQGHRLKPTDFKILESSSGSVIELHEPKLGGGYSFRGQRGEALFEFTITNGGSYVLTVDHYQGPSTIALGKDYYRQMIVTVLGSVFVLVVVMVILVIITLKQLQKGFERLLAKMMRD